MRAFIPPVLFALLLLAIGVLTYAHPEVSRPIHPSGPPVGEILFLTALGLGILLVARMQFHRRDAEIMTFATPRNLVTNGIYQASRNPMYLGFTIVLIGAALAANVWCASIAPLTFFLAAHFWYVPAEERAAREAFGSDYEAYMDQTRRWL